MWSDKLKEAGVNIHVIATGGGAGLQKLLWEIPGSSAYFSGATFPYDQDEQAELLGFMPEQFCSVEAAIDLASAAYMKAFKFGGKKAIGLGLTASVASTKMHRGDHRVYGCIITDDVIHTCHLTLEKGVGIQQRILDGDACDELGLQLLIDTLHLEETNNPAFPTRMSPFQEQKAREQFFKHPVFTSNGKRLAKFPQGCEHTHALMPGAFNPPHEGHFGLADNFKNEHGKSVIFEIGTNPPHKDPPTVQALLQRAKMLRGYDILFSKDMPLYLEKASQFHGMPFIVGADTMLRILDPKWGFEPIEMLNQIGAYGNHFYVSGREVDGVFVARQDIIYKLEDMAPNENFRNMIHRLEGRWDISSSALRNKDK